MRKYAVITALVVSAFMPAVAFEGNDDNVTRDYYTQLYHSQAYISDFAQTFTSEADKYDYKRLREYINKKVEILRVLKMAGDEYYYGLSYSKLFAVDYMYSLEDDLRTRKPHEKMLVRFNSVRPNFNINGEYTVEHIEAEILPLIKSRFEEAARRDSINEIAYMQIQRNIEVLSQDIFHAEQALHASLMPERRNQDFRIWISLTFSGLIAALLMVFFLIMLKRSDATLSKRFLSGGAGLQFITVFVLIIAVILFGILNVLGGSELAAILSGISGYVLGKGSISQQRVPEDNMPEG